MAAEDGFWMSTHSGRRVYPLALHPGQFHIDDIAQGLSNVTRFSGQGDFYSVAEHSERGSHRAYAAYGVRVAYEFLMHDAAEAYMGGDMVKPIVEILDDYRTLRERMQAAISVAFDLPLGMTPECKEVDVRMLVTEAPVIFHHKDAWWEAPHYPKPYEDEWVTLADRPREGTGDDDPIIFARPLGMQFWPPRMARRKFMEQYHRLRKEIDDDDAA